MNGRAFKLKNPVTNGYQDLKVSLRDRISNPIIQSLDAFMLPIRQLRETLDFKECPKTA